MHKATCYTNLQAASVLVTNYLSCMKKAAITLAILYLFNAHIAFTQTKQYNLNNLYGTAQLQTDFKQLRRQLEQKHVNLYLYTPRPQMNRFFDSLYNSIDSPMTSLQFYAVIAALSSVIKNGHSYVLPAETERDYYNKHAVFLPLHISWIDGKMYADMNCSSDTTLHDGDEITAINGLPANTVMHALLRRQVRDGNNTTYPVWILNNYFREYYSYIYGHPTSFEITYKTGSGNTTKTTIKALSKDSIKHYQQQCYAARLPKPGKGITLAFNTDTTIATLTIKTFDSEELKEAYGQDFKTVMHDYFHQINQHHISKLILDLRNNQGGDPQNGITLLSYLLGQPFEMIHKGPEATGMHNPSEQNYKGKLFVLINGGSFSNTGMVSACLKRNKRCIFIGEEAGGNNCTLSGDTETFTLPNTLITFEIATQTYLLSDAMQNTGHGVIPAFVITPSISDIITGKDAVMDKAMEIAGK